MSANIADVAVKATNATPLSKPILPYRRERDLAELGMFQPRERLDLLTLQLLLGEPLALHTISRVCHKLWHALQVERWRGAERSWLYDINRHLNLAYCLAEETKLGRRLVRAYFATRGLGNG